MPYIKGAEQKFIEITRLIKGYSGASSLAKKLGISYGTAKSRLDHPEDFTLGELLSISKRLHIPKEEIIASIKF